MNEVAACAQVRVTKTITGWVNRYVVPLLFCLSVPFYIYIGAGTNIYRHILERVRIDSADTKRNLF